MRPSAFARSNLGAFIRSPLGVRVASIVRSEEPLEVIRLFATASGGNYIYSTSLSDWVNLSTVSTSSFNGVSAVAKWFQNISNLFAPSNNYSGIEIPSLVSSAIFDFGEPNNRKLITTNDGATLIVVFFVPDELFAASWDATNDWQRLGCGAAVGFAGADGFFDVQNTSHGLYCAIDGARAYRYNSGTDTWQQYTNVGITLQGQTSSILPYSGGYYAINNQGIYSVSGSNLDPAVSWTELVDLSGLSLSDPINERTLARWNGNFYFGYGGISQTSNDIYKNDELIASVSGGAVRAIIDAGDYLLIAGTYTSLTPAGGSPISGSIHRHNGTAFQAFGSITSATNLFYSDQPILLSILTQNAEMALSATNANISIDAPEPLSILSISPDNGSTAGGTAVTITGTGFTSDCEFRFQTRSDGPELLQSVTIVSSTEATGDTPAWPYSAGLVDVVVEDTVTLEIDTLIDGFEFT